MKGSSKVIMGATLAMVLLLAIVLALVLVLLAELYCSILLRRRKLNSKSGSMAERPESPPTSLPSQAHDQSDGPSPLSSFYAQGVLAAPRSFLFPKLPSKKEKRGYFEDIDIENQKHRKLHHFLRVQSPHQSSLPTSASPSPSYISLVNPLNSNKPIRREPEVEAEAQAQAEIDEVQESCGSSRRENLMYISNPIYDNNVGRRSTPFETPESSPSQLDRSDEEDDNVAPSASSPVSLPLTPMKDLPAKASSVALGDVAKCLGMSISDSNSHIGRSSSSSDTPRTSPSW